MSATVGLVYAASMVACAACDHGDNSPDLDAGSDAAADAVPDAPGKDPFGPGVLSHVSGGWIDSTFLSHDGKRLYFMYSPWNISVLLGSTPPGGCPEGPALPGHTSIPGLEWATDLYFVEWNGATWSAPQNLGASINTAGQECCVWVNDAETEIMFLRGTDFDDDGKSGDLGLPVSGNYRSTRASKNDPWGPAVIMEGRYGSAGQGKVGSVYVQVTDLHKTPSGNIYGWETDVTGKDRLVFGRWNGGGHDAPVVIAGSEHADTQVWVSNDERLMMYNHRNTAADTTLRRMVRNTAAQPWGPPSTLPTLGFADSRGAEIWGEPTFTADGEQMLFARFNTTDPVCWRDDLMRARGNSTDGYRDPNIMN